MTHTVADAEAAIRRNPESLEELSKATDLMIEAGDPRGEDFAACLSGDLSPEDVQRRHPADTSAMFVAAWAMAAGVPCGCRTDYFCTRPPCQECDADAMIRQPVKAEALRLLAECGKVGTIREPGPHWYFYWSIPEAHPHEKISDEWWSAGRDLRRSFLEKDAVTARMDLLDAYARAAPDTRKRWAKETRALTPREETAP